jgi:hypothetical protein
MLPVSPRKSRQLILKVVNRTTAYDLVDEPWSVHFCYCSWHVRRIPWA